MRLWLCVGGWVDVLPEGHFDVVLVVLDVRSLSWNQES